ncbi:hypothetical protein HaLaN_15709 [Haematococcus lacustris]|uniref:Uncharacterized protein n=1 Tax=Haematococcus lacustris TaxID=44745 RepID=A0A699Z870_HAELA|nr:hypothetical protein HaLaN_15709 [Haematococcus lacustris]
MQKPQCRQGQSGWAVATAPAHSKSVVAAAVEAEGRARQLTKQAKQRWLDRILALAYGAAGLNGSVTIGCRGVLVSQLLKEALRQFPPG